MKSKIVHKGAETSSSYGAYFFFDSVNKKLIVQNLIRKVCICLHIIRTLNCVFMRHIFLYYINRKHNISHVDNSGI